MLQVILGGFILLLLASYCALITLIVARIFRIKDGLKLPFDQSNNEDDLHPEDDKADAEAQVAGKAESKTDKK